MNLQLLKWGSFWLLFGLLLDPVHGGTKKVPETFGFGAHICLGFPLARLEGQVALPAVLARWGRLELASEAIEWMDSMVLRGMKAMPVRATAW